MSDMSLDSENIYGFILRRSDSKDRTRSEGYLKVSTFGYFSILYPQREYASVHYDIVTLNDLVADLVLSSGIDIAHTSDTTLFIPQQLKKFVSYCSGLIDSPPLRRLPLLMNNKFVGDLVVDILRYYSGRH